MQRGFVLRFFSVNEIKLIEYLYRHLYRICRNQQMHITGWKYIVHTVYRQHISVTHVAIFREVHDKGYIYRNITGYFEPMQRYKTLNSKNNAWFKNHMKDEIQM